MEAVTKVIEKATDLVLELFIRQVGYIVCYKNNVEELKDHVDEIKLAIERVEHQVKEAKRNGQEIEAAVLKCLEDAAHKIHQHEEFQKDEGHTKTGCSMAFFPHLWFRHRLGRRAKKMTLDVRPLLGKLKIEKVDYRNDPKSIEAALCNVGYESFGSRADIIRNIKEALEEATAKRIGVFGLGGVGKTTLVKEIAKKVEDEKLFDRVVMVSVTRDPNLRKIQGEIAYILGLRFEEESEVVRAELIRKRLKLEEENVLIILDDLWEGLDLNKLGISIDEDDINKMKVKDIPNSNFGMVDKEKSSGNYRKCKILLTSRNREVLSTHMDVEKKWIFSVGLLNETEASTLFRKVAGVSEKESEFEAIAAEIVKKCDGLPVAIIAIGKTLRDKTMSEWKDALEQLNKQGFTGVQKSMDSSIKLSYDHLESEELKSLFLLRAQMCHRPLIMDLIKYCIGLGILQGVHKIREARSRMEILIQKLKDHGLLLDSDSSDYYNMHDTVRDAALLIASKEQNVFTLRNGKLDEWPDKDELERCTAISLYNSNVIDELPEVLNCPQLKVFHIDSDDPSMRIPDNFFEGMTKLRVLVLTGFHLPHLPPSIKCLTNLRMLSIERCKLGVDLSLIGRLKKLRILSLSNSDFEMLPEELGQLLKLQLFDASNCSKLRVIPPNVISRLTNLEELYMRDSLIQQEAEGETSRSQVSVLDDLRDLNQLVTLDICIWNAALLPRDLFFDKLNNYMIAVGNFKTLSVGDFVIPDKYEASRTLALQLKEDCNIHSLKGIKMLFKRLENLLLGEIKGVNNVLQQLNLEGFPCLKHLSIMNNSEIRYIINTLEFSYPRSAFPKLESLCLYKLENMEILCCNQLTDDSLCNLKTIKIHICHRLKNLFSSHIVRLLTKLETVEVFECSSLKEIVIQEKSVNDNNAAEDNKLKFPQLRTLKLRSLPAFTVFNNITQSIERRDPNIELTEIIAEDEHAVPSSLSLFSEQVAIPNLENLELSSINIEKIWDYQFSPTFGFGKLVKLNVDDCKRLKYLFSLPIAKNLENLKSLSVSGCEMMEEIFDTKEISAAMEETKEIIVHAAEDIIFPNLEKIQLSQMKSLKTIWPSKLNKLRSFCNLASVVIKDCGELLLVFSPHMTGRIQNFVTLNVSNCNSVQEIFDLKDSQQEDRIETKLQAISINSLKNLKHVWNKDPEGILNFESLQNVIIRDCPELKHLFPTSVAKGLQKLKELEIRGCPEMEDLVARLEEGLETCSIPFVFPQLTTLYLENMPKLIFYRGSHTLEWQAMKSLMLINCNKPEAFTTNTIQFQLILHIFLGYSPTWIL